MIAQTEINANSLRVAHQCNRVGLFSFAGKADVAAGNSPGVAESIRIDGVRFGRDGPRTGPPGLYSVSVNESRNFVAVPELAKESVPMTKTW